MWKTNPPREAVNCLQGESMAPKSPPASKPRAQPVTAIDASRAGSAAPTGAQLATAFDGQLEPARTSVLYRLAIVLVFFAMILLPVIYFAIIAGAAAGVGWYAVHATTMFRGIRSGRAGLILGVAYVAPLIAGALLV